MAEARAIASLHAQLAPAKLVLLAEPRIGPPVAVVCQPPSLLLHGAISLHVQAQLDAARTAPASSPPNLKLSALEWANSRLAPARAPPHIDASPLRLTSLRAPSALKVVEAREVARLLEKFNPRYAALVLGVGRVLYCDESWQALVDAAGASGHAHAHLLFIVARQAFGRCQALVRPRRRKKPGTERSAAEIAEEWREVAGLLSLAAELSSSLPISCVPGSVPSCPTPSAAASPAAAPAAAAPAAPTGPEWITRGEAPNEQEAAVVMGRCETLWKEAEAAARRLPAWSLEARTERRQWLDRWLHHLYVERGVLVDPYPRQPTLSLRQAADVPAALTPLLQRLEAPIRASSVVHGARSGSYMYNLHTAASDEDYHFVFLAPTHELLQLYPPSNSFRRAVEASYAADKAGEVECTGIELGRFVELLTMGNPGVVELLWLDGAAVARRGGWVHEAWPWGELVSRREEFRTLMCVAQYEGFVVDHLWKAREFLSADDETDGQTKLARFSKAAYNALHKVFEAMRLVRGEDLHVELRGEELQLVRRLRTEQLVGDLAPSSVLELIEQRLAELKQAAALATKRLHPYADGRKLDEWLLSVRMRQLAVNQPLPLKLPPARNSSSASSTPDADELEQVVGEATVARVQASLDALERAYDIQIAFAVERSSRMLGSDHAGSDCDVIAVFVLSRRSYFSMYKCEVAHHQKYDSVEISLYEARHACSLLASSNPTMLDALLSPLVYRSAGDWLQRARQLADEHYSRQLLRTAWVQGAKANNIKYIRAPQRKGEGVVRKKYLHVLRPLLNVKWLHAHQQLGTSGVKQKAASSIEGGAHARRVRWPPLRLVDLADDLSTSDLPADVRREIFRLLEPSERCHLRFPGPPILVLQHYIDVTIEAEIGHVDGSLPPSDDMAAAQAFAAWDGFCVDMVSSLTTAPP
ncbi:hypothetical protein AB1Y20_005355 [Prymnesium parvum]|uniref:Uncharacterized protein n=1 Tax=Prymnesium parvum TaxID=97485 RepID=A0AB34J350_PRYPA